MNKFKKKVIFFAIGSVGYGLIEVLWRGHTHWSMLIAGGICFVFFSSIAKSFKKKPLIFKALLCSVAVTVVELVFGIIFNLILKMNVWDYSNMPFNFQGQICPLFTLIWGALGFVFIPLANKLNEMLKI